MYAKQRRWYPYVYDGDELWLNMDCYKTQGTFTTEDEEITKKTETIICPKCKRYFSIDKSYSIKFKLAAFKGWKKRHECVK